MSSHVKGLSAEEALLKLQQGNEKYLNASVNPGDVSPAIRKDTCENGQFPYAVVITCSDSRVIPESIFSAGIGELFTIRVAGNVVKDFEPGSVEYAVDHLGSNLVVVLGHTNCGVVGAAIGGGAEGFIKTSTDEIKEAIEQLALKYHPNDTAANRTQTIAGEWKSFCIMKLSIEHMTGKEAKELAKKRW